MGQSSVFVHIHGVQNEATYNTSHARHSSVRIYITKISEGIVAGLITVIGIWDL